MGVMVWADGLREVNPGDVACYSWVAYCDGRRFSGGRDLVAMGADATNNVAECRAVIGALQRLLSAEYKNEPSNCNRTASW